MLIRKVHHVAYRCVDAKETVQWYEKHLAKRAPHHAAWMHDGSLR
jgi:catechol 2,3-dioxygenase-like lactoylglutathione lyase family enzyme